MRTLHAKVMREGSFRLTPVLPRVLRFKEHVPVASADSPVSCGQAARSRFPLYFTGQRQGTNHGYPVAQKYSNLTLRNSNLYVRRSNWHNNNQCCVITISRTSCICCGNFIGACISSLNAIKY